MRSIEYPDFEAGNTYQKESASLEYDYRVASRDRRSGRTWKNIARAGAMLFGLAIPVTNIVGHIEHAPKKEIEIISIVEGGAVYLSRLGFRESRDSVERNERKMDNAAA